jgi:hypothetical protein
VGPGIGSRSTTYGNSPTSSETATRNQRHGNDRWLSSSGRRLSSATTATSPSTPGDRRGCDQCRKQIQAIDHWRAVCGESCKHGSGGAHGKGPEGTSPGAYPTGGRVGVVGPTRAGRKEGDPLHRTTPAIIHSCAPIQTQLAWPAPKDLVQPYTGITPWAGCPVPLSAAPAWSRSASIDRPSTRSMSSRAIASSCSTRGRAPSSRPLAA